MATMRGDNIDDHLEFEQVLGGLLEVIHTTPRAHLLQTIERLSGLIQAHAEWEEQEPFRLCVSLTGEQQSTLGLIKDHELIRGRLSKLQKMARRGRSRAVLERELFELHLFLWCHLRREQALYADLLLTGRR